MSFWVQLTLIGSNLQNRLDDLITYFEKHGQLRWYESRSLIQPVELVPNDTRWSRKQLRKGCTDCKDSAYWWEQKYPSGNSCAARYRNRRAPDARKRAGMRMICGAMW